MTKYKTAVAILSLTLLAACTECKVEYQPGEIVYGRLDGAEYLVLKQSSIENMDGYCLVLVRSKKGWSGNLSAVELTKVKP